MALPIFLFMIGCIVLIQAAIPFLLKRTIVFGVTIPEGHTEDPRLQSFRKTYAVVTFIVGLLASVIFYIWARGLTEETIALSGSAVLFGIIFVSMALYFYFHAKTTLLKRENNWGADLKQVKLTDLNIRSKDEMLPWYVYLIPMIITVGLIAYTASQYSNLPDLIPTHWGPDGQPDAFAAKSPLSAVSLPLILLIMQFMFLGIHVATKMSGIKLSAVKGNTSRIRQLSFRKYTSWLLFLINILVTLLFGYLQLTTLHEKLGGKAIMMIMPIAFLLVILVSVGIYAFKVGQGGSRLDVEIIDDPAEGITDADEDRYWKGGLLYVNKNDPSIFVEKRFGVGWTLNFANPLGYLIVFGPILLILVITFLI